MNKLHNAFDKRINFVPEIILNTRARRLKAMGAGVAGVLLFVLLVWPVLYLNAYNRDSVEKIIVLQVMYNDYKEKADDVRRLERETQEVLGKKDLLDQVAKNARVWGPVLQVVADSVPGEMWFYALELTPYTDPFQAQAQAQAETETADPATEDPAQATTPAAATNQTLSPIPGAEQIPQGRTSVITIRGGAKTVDTVGKFMYKLNTLYNFGRVDLKGITRSAENNTIDF